MKNIKYRFRSAASKLCAALFGSIVSVNTGNKEVSLTFDDGPSPEFTPRLLDVLSRYEAKATFFVLGVIAEKYPDLVRQVIERGHEVGNHSWDHPSLVSMRIKEIKAQLLNTKQILEPFGQSLMRPPFGHQNLRSYLTTRLCGYRVILWNLIAEDWLDKDAEWLANNLVKKIKPGSIVIFHDSLYHALENKYRDRGATILAVEKLLNSLSEYKFVTVSTLLAGGSPVKRYCAMSPPKDFLDRLKVKTI